VKLEHASILYVEDEPFLRESMGAWFKQKTGRAFCAEHGAEALEILAANKIDLVITDVRMPVMDGITLIKRINQATTPRPHVILLTGFSDVSLRQAYDLGVGAVLEKPIDREELLDVMQRGLIGLYKLREKKA
jgi:YesN/AraC family two-component response regulator